MSTIINGTDNTAATPALTGSDTDTGVFFPSANTMAFSTGGTEKMRVDSSGNVGIGTSSATSLLQVGSTSSSNNTLTVASANNTAAQINLLGDSSATVGMNVKYEGNGNFFAVSSNNAGSLTERMRIDSSGNVGIGTSSPSAKFHVAGSANNANIGVAYVQSSVTGDTANNGLSISKFDNNSTTSQIFVKFAIANFGAGSGQINANGANAAAFGSYSDSRLKENIVNLPSQLENITLLRPVEFDYIESEGGGHQIGFIAQEMQEVYPDAVGERSDGMLTVTGWNKTEARLVKAIQELKAELDTVKAELATLKA